MLQPGNEAVTVWLAPFETILASVAVKDALLPAVVANVKLAGPSVTVSTPVGGLLTVITATVVNVLVAVWHCPGVGAIVTEQIGVTEQEPGAVNVAVVVPQSGELTVTV